MGCRTLKQVFAAPQKQFTPAPTGATYPTSAGVFVSSKAIVWPPKTLSALTPALSASPVASKSPEILIVTNVFAPTRRQLLLLGTAAAALLTAPALRAQEAKTEPQRGGTLTYVFSNESPNLVAINSTTGTAWTLGPKIFDGLLQYEADLTPLPQLATEWTVSDDGLRYEFKLRPGVKWHDGTDFTADDVAFSILHLKVAHPRGRGTFAHVTAVETPDPLTAIIELSAPAPYLLSALAATESPIIPKHIFEGTDPAAIPEDTQLVGTGPFVFNEYVRGSHVIVDRNPNYWDAPKPYLDRIIFRFITDAAARAAAVQNGEVDIAPIPLSDVERIRALPNLAIEDRAFAYSGTQYQLIFNFDNKYLADQRVRKAIAHAIDLKIIANTVFYGFADVSPSPISVTLPKFHDNSIQPYAVDLDKANAILDDAGYARGADGKRFSIRLLFNPAHDKRLAEYVRQALSKIGIDAPVETFDFATYIKTVYTDRAFDLTSENLANAFDPTVGVQRVYWSKNFKVGLPFSNAAHYANPEVDRLLEAASIEPDEKTRWQLFSDFQKLIAEDLPAINTVAPKTVLAYNRRVHNFALGAEGDKRNFADTWIEQ